MQVRPSSRSSSMARMSCLAALVMAIMTPGRPARASLAPAQPTFTLKWGSSGTGPGHFNGPQGMTIDADGNLYVADRLNNRVQKFDAFGNSKQAGSLTSAGTFAQPTGVTVDPDGNLWVVDNNGSPAARKFTSGGTFLGSRALFLGAGTIIDDIAADTSGSLYVCAGNEYLKYFSNGARGTFDFVPGQKPVAVSLGLRGALYYVTNAHTVRMYSTVGLVPTLIRTWGGIGNTDGKFAFPTRITTDALGNVYVVDSGNCRVQKFTRDGVFLGKWGTCGSGDGQFNGASGIAVDPAGNSYVGETGANRIQKFSGAGNPLSFTPPFYWLQWGTPGIGTGQFNSPSGIAIDHPTGALYTYFYVTDSNNNRVHRFRTYGGELFADLTFGSAGTGNGQFQLPWGVATDPSGKVFVTDIQNRRVQKFSNIGGYEGQWGGYGIDPGQFVAPTGIAIDDSGSVYVVDTGTSRVQKFTGNGTFIMSWGSIGSGPGQFSVPMGITVDAAGLVYVTDVGNARIEKFTRTGDYVGEWGSPGSGPGQFGNPSGVRADRDGNVLVTDSDNNRIQMFTSNGTFLTEWGSLGSGNGQFTGPTGICTDPAGNVFVTDANNHRIQEFSFPPRILMVSDAPRDQGGNVRVRFARSTVDAPGILGGPFYSYRTSYRNDAVSSWQVAVESFATGDDEYNVIVNVPVTANPSNWFFTNVRVQAFPAGGFAPPVDGGSESGFPVDNLSPPPPTAFVAEMSDGSVRLSWSASTAPDFAAFRLHRGVSADFRPSADNLLTETTGTSYADELVSGSVYKLTAVDRNGNESEYALATGSVSQAGEAARFALRGALQNPTPADRFVVSFSLARAAPAQLQLYDVAGRRVVQREVGEMGPGWHRLRLVSDTRIASGIYHLRLTQDGQTQTARVAVVH